MRVEPFAGQRQLTLDDELQGRDARELADAFGALEATGQMARVYLSYIAIPGITPPQLMDDRSSDVVLEGKAADGSGKTRHIQRREGIFPIDAGLVSFMNHGLLYGDGVFEGERIDESGRWVLCREHALRMAKSLQQVGIRLPFTQEEYRQKIFRTVQAVAPQKGKTYYIRPLVSSGDGDMGINRKKCVGPFVAAYVGGIKLYPDVAYQEGIDLGVAENVPLAVHPSLDPRIKATQYLKNILALNDGTRGTRYSEALMFTYEGHLAEATVDNVFLSVTGKDGRTTLYTPPTHRCLNGLTRRTIMLVAREAGMTVKEQEVDRDWLFDHISGRVPDVGVELFVSGTGARMLPVRSVLERPVGDGKPGPIFRKLLEGHDAKVAERDLHVRVDVSDAEFAAYLKRPTPYDIFG